MTCSIFVLKNTAEASGGHHCPLASSSLKQEAVWPAMSQCSLDLDHTCCCPSSILYFLYSPNQGCDPFQEYMPSIFNTMPLSFCFLIKYSELHISLFPAALVTATDFWHIVLPLPSSQTVLKISSFFFLAKE